MPYQDVGSTSASGVGRFAWHDAAATHCHPGGMPVRGRTSATRQHEGGRRFSHLRVLVRRDALARDWQERTGTPDRDVFLVPASPEMFPPAGGRFVLRNRNNRSRGKFSFSRIRCATSIRLSQMLAGTVRWREPEGRGTA